MADKIFKTYRAEVKEVDAQSGLIQMLIPMSTNSIDRDGEIVEPAGAKKSLPEFMKRPVLLSSHDYHDLRKQIGEFKKLKISDDGLMADGIQYYIGQGNDEADWAFNLASKGMAAFSIGFIPTKWETIDQDKDDFMGNRRYTEWELLEVSQVVVPGNRDAIQGIRGKAIGDKVALELIDDVEKYLDAVSKPYPNEHACRLRDPDDFQDDSFKRTEREHEGKKYSIIMGRLKGEDTMTEQAYRYNKDTWSAGEASKHCKDHDGSFEAAKEPKEISQAQLIDDIEYTLLNIEKAGIGENAMSKALELANEIIKRHPGTDIPDDILTKVGAVLNAKNKDRLNKIQQLAQEVLDSAGSEEEEGDKQYRQPELDTVELAKQRAIEVAEVAEFVIAKLKGKRIPK